jgi:aspartate/methionine/tyrosine aminotransferase
MTAPEVAGSSERRIFSCSSAALRGSSAERAASLAVIPRKNLIALHKGDPCFATPDHICAAQQQAVEQGYTHYPELRGDVELREVIAACASRGAARNFSADEVLITAGATEAIFCAMTAYLDAGDEVLVFDPTFSLYAPVIRQTGATPVSVAMTPEFRIDPDHLKSSISARTKMIVVNNPANPTGVVLTPEEVVTIAELAAKHDLLILTDEVYDHLLYGARHIRLIDMPQVADRFLYVNSFSKTYAMTGWRLGYVLAPTPLLAPIITIHANSLSQVHWPTQRAGIAALTGSQDVVESMRAGYDARRRVLIEALALIPNSYIPEPQGAFYAFFRFDTALGLTSAQVTRALFEAGVAVRSGSEFGQAGEGWLRLTFAASVSDIERGAGLVRATLAQLAVAKSASGLSTPTI